MIFGAETHLGRGVMSAIAFPFATLPKHLLRLSLAVQLSVKAHEESDYNAMNAIMH